MSGAAGSERMGWTFAWLRAWDDVWAPANVARWAALIAAPDAHASPFATPAMVRIWLAALGGPERFAPAFLWARHDSGQEVAWPLVILRGGVRHGFLRLMIPVGAAPKPLIEGMTLFDYQEPVAAPAAAGASVLAPGFWAAFRAELRRREGDWFDRCAFPKLRAVCFGPEAEPTPIDAAPFLRLAPYPDLEAFLMARKPRLRTNIRRSFRLLEAEGALSFRVHDATEAEAILGWLPALEAARLERYPGSEMPAGFLRNLVTEGLAARMLACSSLSLDGKPISWDIGFVQGGVYYGYIRSFDMAYAQMSPGTAHLARLVEWMIATGGTKLDFLLGQEKYKAGWTDGEEMVVAGTAFRSSAASSVARRGLARAVRAAGGMQKARPGVGRAS